MIEETLKPNFKERNPIAYKFWNIILKLLIILVVGFGLLYLLPLVTNVGDGFGLILPFEILVALAGVVAILIYPALYLTLKPWLSFHIPNFSGFKKGFYLVLCFPCYALLMYVVIFYSVTFLHNIFYH